MEHGDDTATVGEDASLNWFAIAFGQKLGVKARARVGPKKTEAKCARRLDRSVEWRPGGIRYGAEQRHVGEVAQARGPAEGEAAVAPGGHEKESSSEDGEKLGAPDARWPRGLVAKLTFVAQDKPDIQNAAEEASREMGAPTGGSARRPKRLARYFRGASSARLRYRRQGEHGVVTAVVDADSAGCDETRGSIWGTY